MKLKLITTLVGLALSTCLFIQPQARGESLAPFSIEDSQEQFQFFKKFNQIKNLIKKSDSQAPYVFDPSILQQIVAKYIDQPLEVAFSSIHMELKERYPGKIMDNYRFVFNDAGAALGQVAILYASPREYLIFFGSPISTGGFSGRYKHAEFYDIMIEGEMETVIEGQYTKQTYKPGEMAYLARGVAKGYQLEHHGWMLEYSRGQMLSSFGFGVIGPAMFLTMDWDGATAQISDFLKALVKSSF